MDPLNVFVMGFEGSANKISVGILRGARLLLPLSLFLPAPCPCPLLAAPFDFQTNSLAKLLKTFD